MKGGVENLVIKLDADKDDGIDAPLAGIDERMSGVIAIERVDEQNIRLGAGCG